MPHLYRHFGKDGSLLYIGISLSAINRLGQHKDHSHWFESISRVEIENFETREETIEAEAKAIFAEKPKHNIMRPRHNQLMLEEARKRKAAEDEKRKSLAEKSRKELTGNVVRFNILYTPQEVAKVLNIGSTSLRRLINERKLGAVTLPPNKEGISRHGVPYKSKEAISGWQLISYLESLHKEPI
jgi:predicted GIY-YIG superfamily endonuclease